MTNSVKKRNPRAPKTPTTGTPTPKSKTGIPAPYSTPPPVLAPFLHTLNPKHVYITHIDEHSRNHKMRIFTVPVLMNIALAGLLFWRARVAVPKYFAILLALLGYDDGVNADVAHADSSTLIDIILGRTFFFFIDFMLAKIVLPWPMDFFLGEPVSPVTWRSTIGFQDKEVVVRRSRKWDESLPKDWLEEEADGSVYKDRIMPAIDREWVKAKTSYLMMDKSWDLDFEGMLSAHELIRIKKASLQDFRKMVIVHSEDHGWLVWQVWKLDEGNQEEGRQKIVLFKDKLTAMGKENLFFRWIEIIQFESTQPGGFTPERQAIAMKNARELFEAEGVDFDQFWKEVGGVQGLPGMDNTSTE